MTRKAPPEQIALFPEPREETRAAPALATYDLIILSTSGGKDSQAMMDTMVERASALGLHDRLRAVHADLDLRHPLPYSPADGGEGAPWRSGL